MRLFAPVLRNKKADIQKYLIKPYVFLTFSSCELRSFRCEQRTFQYTIARCLVDCSIDLFISFQCIFNGFWLNFLIIFDVFSCFLFHVFFDDVSASIFKRFWLHFSSSLLPNLLKKRSKIDVARRWRQNVAQITP